MNMSQNDPEMGVSFANEEERNEVLQEIERLTSGAQGLAQDVTLQALRHLPRGIWFPLMINLASLGLFVGGLFGAQWYFGQRQEQVRVQTQQQFSAEGRLVAKLLEESQRRLREQQERISQIQGEFERLSRERDSLAGQFEQQLREREALLRQELESRLSAERARLQQQGLSPAEIERRLRDFETRQNQELEATLRRAREEAEREIQAREAQLASLNQALAQARQAEEETRRQLQAQAQGQISNLETQLSEQAAVLDRLSQEREIETNIFRQIEAGLAEVRRGLETDAATALERLAVVEGLINANLPTASEGLARRLRAFQTATNTLRESLGRLTVRDVAERLAEDPRLGQLTQLVQQAREAPAARRAELWTQALDLIQEASEAATGLRQLDEERRRQEQTQREQIRLALARQALGTLDPAAPETWEKLYDAIAPADAALYEVELRNGVERVLRNGLETARRPAQETVQRLEGELEQLRQLNRSLTERAAAAEARQSELESLVQDLRRQLDEMGRAAGTDAEAAARLAASRQEVERLGRELEELRRSREDDRQRLSEREAALARLEAEKQDLLRQLAGQSTDRANTEELAGLRDYRDRVERFRQAYAPAAQAALRELSEARSQTELDQAIRKLSQTVSEADRTGLLPGFNQLLDALTAGQSRLLVKPEEVDQARKRAFNDVLSLTTYLKGSSGRGESLSADLRSLSLRDADFARVVQSIQELTVRGAEEVPISLSQWRPVGSVVSAVGERLNVELLTSPETVLVGLRVQIRRPGAEGTVLALGRVQSVSGRRAVIQLTSREENQRLPIGGDVVFLEVP